MTIYKWHHTTIKLSIIKQQFVVTRTIRETDIPHIIKQLVYKHTFSKNVVFAEKFLVLTIFVKILRAWFLVDLGSVEVFIFYVKLFIGGSRQTAVSWAIRHL